MVRSTLFPSLSDLLSETRLLYVILNFKETGKYIKYILESLKYLDVVVCNRNF